MALRKTEETIAQENYVKNLVTETHEVDGVEVESIEHKSTAERLAEEVTATAISKAKTTAVSTPRPRIMAAYCEWQNAITPQEVASLGVGAFPRITVDLGGFVMDKDPLGQEIKIDLVSWNNRYMVTTGANDDEAKGKVKVSYDGETIMETGESVAEVLAQFREDGYTKAACKGYIDLFGMLTYANGKNLASEENLFVQVQLSPESVKKWKAFQVETGYKAGIAKMEVPSIIVLKAQRAEWKGNRYGYASFSMK